MIEYYRFYEVETLMTQGKLQEAIAELRSLQKLYLELSQDNSKLKVQLHDLEEILCISQNIIFARELRAEVLQVSETVRKEEAGELYRILE